MSENRQGDLRYLSICAFARTAACLGCLAEPPGPSSASVGLKTSGITSLSSPDVISSSIAIPDLVPAGTRWLLLHDILSLKQAAHAVRGCPPLVLGMQGRPVFLHRSQGTSSALLDVITGAFFATRAFPFKPLAP